MKITDNNRVPQLVHDLNTIRKAKLEVGVFGKDDSHILMIARVHEFGVQIDVTDAMRGYLAAIGYPLKKETDQINIPERSFIRTTFDEQEKAWVDFAQKRLEKVVAGRMKARSMLDQIGAKMASDIQETIVEIKDPKNAGMTVERKGSSNPLVDSGRLMQSITWRLVGI